MSLYNSFVDKVVASVFLFALFNVNEGHGFFYPPPNDARPQGHQQPLYEYHEPPNRVGYGYKPSWAEVHLQALAEETPQYQQPQYQQAQPVPQQAQPVEKPSYQPQQEISEPQYTLPANTYLQPSEKYQISPQKYQWVVHPSVKYNVPTISNPLSYRDPNQHVNVLVPLRLFGVQMFPPFLERLIQRVQTYYSIYNPPETLTIPYSINTPPTFPTSSLLPPGDTFITPDDEGTVINAGNIPNIENNSVENNEGVTESAVTQSPDGSKSEGSSTESSTAAESSSEDTAKEESTASPEENSTDQPSSSTSSEDEKSDDNDANSETSTASGKSDEDSSSQVDATESTNSDDEGSSNKEDSTEPPATEAPLS